jgi:gliding motility-associated-like protein
VFLAMAQQPTVPASNIIVSDIYCSQATVSWTSGNGANRIVVASKGAPFSSLIADQFYLSNSDYGSGHSFTTSEFVVYNGINNSVVVSNLEKNTIYYFAVFEYNGSGTTFFYRTAGYPETSVTTADLQADFSINDPYQCINGNSFSFTPSVTVGGASALSYSWKFGDGGTSLLQNPTHTYAAKDMYDVELTVSSTQCETVVIKPDTVAPKPDVSFELDASIAGNTAIQCFLKPDGTNNFYKYLNTSDYGFLATGFSFTVKEWKFGDGTTELNTNDNFIEHEYVEPGVYEVKFIVSNSFNNVEYCTDSASMMVEVKPRPIDSALLSLDSIQCANQNLFNFEYGTDDASIVSTWSFGDGNTANGNSVTHTYASEGAYEITLEATDGSGCYDVYQDSVRLVAQPANDFSGLDASSCLGYDAISLSALVAGGEWIGDNVDANGLFSPVTLGANEVAYTIESEGCSDTVRKTINIFDLPRFLIGPDTSICSGTSFTKRIDKENTTILWSTGDTDSFTEVSSDGILWAQRLANGCVFRDSMVVAVISPPVIVLGPDTLLCGGGQKIIDVRSSEATYIWSDGYSGGGERVITSTGSYSVIVENKCGTATDDINLEFLPYACDIFMPNAFSPNGDGLNDVFRPSGNIIMKSMEVYNRWGELLYESSGETFAWDGNANGQRVQQGVYFFIIRYDKPDEEGLTPITLSGKIQLVY